jgi:hypothetical protein
MESSSYAPVQQDQAHSMDWFQYGSDLESEVEFIARNPTVEPYSVAKSMITENTPVGTPNDGWRKTSWPDFEEFTPLVCGDREHSSHTRGGNSNAPLQGAVVAFDISKAYSVICPATCLRGHTSAGFRSASAASPVATTSKPIMQRMVDREVPLRTNFRTVRSSRISTNRIEFEPWFSGFESMGDSIRRNSRISNRFAN